MYRLTFALCVASLCCAGTAGADTPPTARAPESAPAATVPNPAPAPSAAAAANAPSAATLAPATTTATDAVPGNVGGLTETEVKRAFAKFRKQQRDGETLFCRKETPLGSRLGKTVCYTEDQVLANARAERDASQMQGQQNICGIGSCSPSGD